MQSLHTLRVSLLQLDPIAQIRSIRCQEALKHCIYVFTTGLLYYIWNNPRFRNAMKAPGEKLEYLLSSLLAELQKGDGNRKQNGALTKSKKKHLENDG